MFKVQRWQCNQCLFTRNKIVPSERKEQIIKDTRAKDTFFVCHKGSIAGENVCCRGYWNKFKDEFQAGQIAQRLNCVELVEIT